MPPVFDGDNQGVAAGVVITLDVGGALEFRAQGDPKGKAFGASVREIDTLRTDADNPHARQAVRRHERGRTSTRPSPW